jgi:IS30 family transposase
VSEKEAFRASDLMNNKPRKSLGYQTPLAVFELGVINQQKVALRI